MEKRNEFNLQIGKRIKERRLAMGMTQQDLADKMNFKTRQSISSIEKGINGLDPEQLKTLAKHLNCSVEYLMGWNVDKEEELVISEISSELSAMSVEQLKRIKKYAQLINKGEL